MRKPQDLTGEVFNEWTVLAKSDTNSNGTWWVCRCSCGAIHSVRGDNLKSWHSKQCKACAQTKHKEFDRLRENVWKKMIRRCECPSDKSYKNYGAKGVKVCEEWHDYETFKRWAYSNGYDDLAPYGTCTIDRIDVTGNYEPDNCRFIDIAEQNRNKRRHHVITYNNETHILSEWARILGIKRETLNNRIRNGWSIEKVLSQPVRRKTCHKT